MDVGAHLPLTEATYFILLSLAPGPSHGYAIMKDVLMLSQGRVVLSTGTLYGALKRLLELDWIYRTEDPQLDGNDRPRKTYRLTVKGRGALEAEVTRLESLLSVAQKRAVAGRA